MKLTADFLLDNPALVEPVAPWCRRLDRLQLAIVSTCPPWAYDKGPSRADLERRSHRISAQIPLGPIYFQRVSRAVKDLEKRGVLGSVGSGRQRRYRLTARGFAALILNLCAAGDGGATDLADLELRCTLVGRWNLLAERLTQLGTEHLPAAADAGFFDRLRALELWGEPVLSDQLLRQAMDVSQLIATERQRLAEKRRQTAGRLEQVRATAAPWAQIDFGRTFARSADHEPAPELFVALQELAEVTLPRLDLEATLLRLDSQMEYLERLERLYASRLEVVDLVHLKRLWASGQ